MYLRTAQAQKVTQGYICHWTPKSLNSLLSFLSREYLTLSPDPSKSDLRAHYLSSCSCVCTNSILLVILTLDFGSITDFSIFCDFYIRPLSYTVWLSVPFIFKSLSLYSGSGL